MLALALSLVSAAPQTRDIRGKIEGELRNRGISLDKLAQLDDKQNAPVRDVGDIWSDCGRVGLCSGSLK